MKAAQLRLHFIVFLWGFTAILGKLISTDAIALVFWRTLISAAAILLLMKVRKKKVRGSSKLMVRFIGIGFLVSLHWITFFAGAKINISACLAGLATASLMTAFLEPLIEKVSFTCMSWHLGCWSSQDYT